MRGMQDRLIRGGLAGAIGGVTALFVSAPSYFLLHFEREFWVKSLSALVLGHSIRNLPEWLFGYFLYFLWTGWIAALFVKFALPKPGQGDYHLRAVGFSFIGWLITYSLGTFFKVPTLQVKAWQTAVSNIATLVVYGLTVGILTKRWDGSYEQGSRRHRVSSVIRIPPPHVPWEVTLQCRVPGDEAEESPPHCRKVRLVNRPELKQPRCKRVRLTRRLE